MSIKINRQLSLIVFIYILYFTNKKKANKKFLFFNSTLLANIYNKNFSKSKY